MKKILPILIVLIMSMLVFVGCGYDYENKPVSTDKFGSMDISQTLSEFLEAHPDRTSFSPKEKEAAEYLKSKLDGFGGVETSLQEFSYNYTYSAALLSGEGNIDYTFKSQNVIGKLVGKQSKGEKVVIGAYYDNLHSYGGAHEGYYYLSDLPYKYQSTATKSESALAATGVATALTLASELAKYNADTGLAYDVEFVFFGAENFGCQGSKNYVGSRLGANVSLFINLARIGGDNIYAYFDEVSTAHGDLFTDNARSLGYEEVLTTPSMWQPTLGTPSGGDRLLYTNYSVSGSSGQFFGTGTKIANFTTGSWEGVSLTDRESQSYANLCGTSNDKRETLDKACPQYTSQCAVVADTVYATLTDELFVGTLSAENYDYGWLNLPLVGFISVIALCAVLIVVVVLVVRHLEKKYPIVPKDPPKIKVAVFGVEYENPTDADVFIDTKKRTQDDDSFDGNNLK